MPTPLLQPLEQMLQPIRDSLESGRGKPCLIGLHGSTAGFALSLLAHRQGSYAARDAASPWLVIAATEEAAERL